ncbi:hypothetical protein [Streptomyces acidicola]|uniref:hypothetical protein n=1 Tax=Streptomyces acidicola TaxID=2596892 RepID=UPI00382A51F3
MANRTARVAAAGLAALSLMTAASTASASEAGAAARPTGCKYEKLDWGSVASCSSHNGGHYRALVNCKDPATGKQQVFMGPWLQNGNSLAYCQGSYRTSMAAGVETRVS